MRNRRQGSFQIIFKLNDIVVVVEHVELLLEKGKNRLLN